MLEIGADERSRASLLGISSVPILPREDEDDEGGFRSLFRFREAMFHFASRAGCIARV